MVVKLTPALLKKLESELLKQRNDIERQIKTLKNDDPFSDPEHASDNAAVDTDVREQVGHDTIEAEIKDLQKKLSDISLALKKIIKGKYGACEKCAKTIPLLRLEILPEARYCVSCEQKLRR